MKKSLMLFMLLSWLQAPAYALPVIQHWVTGQGARVYFVPAHEIPIVDVRVVFDAGSARDKGKPGLAMLTNAMLPEGAGKLDANAISEKLDGVGAQLGNGVLRDMAWVSMRSLTKEKNIRQSMGTLSLLLSSPAFPEDALKREKKRMQVGYQASLQKPGELAERAFMEALYGSHPYASPPEGDDKSIAALTREDVEKFHRQYYVAKNAVIAIVGDLTRLKAEALAEVLSSGMESGDRAADIPPVPAVEKPVTIHIKHPSTQTHIWEGQPGMSRHDPDYFTLYLGNHTFGGSGLVSLLNEEIREKRGYAYSAYSYFLPMRVAGPFRMTLQTMNEQGGDALKVMRQTLRDFLEKGVTEEQILASKRNITGGFALRLDSNKKLVEYIAMIGFYGLPLDYLNTFSDKIGSATVDQVNDAFRRRVNPAHMVTVIVGPENVADNSKPASDKAR